MLSPQCLAASSGSGSADFEQLEQILEAIPQVKYICLDVANGYSEHFVEFVKDVRKRFPQHTIMVSFYILLCWDKASVSLAALNLTL